MDRKETMDVLWEGGPDCLASWNKCLEQYETLLKAWCDKKGKPKVWAWDCFWRNELPGLLHSREEEEGQAYVTRVEYVDLIKWGMQRNLFRPKQIQMAEELSDAEVQGCTSEQLTKLKEEGIKAAMDTLTQQKKKKKGKDAKMKGCGFVSASIVWSAYDPSVPFMSRCATHSAGVPQGDDSKAPVMLDLVEQFRAKARELAEAEGEGGRHWTARDVELALWSVSQPNGPVVVMDGSQPGAGAQKQKLAAPATPAKPSKKQKTGEAA